MHQFEINVKFIQVLPTEGAPRDQPSASIQPMEDVSAADHLEVQKTLGEAGAGVTSQAGQGTQPVVSSEVQPQQQPSVVQESPCGHVTQSEEATQVRSPDPSKVSL